MEITWLGHSCFKLKGKEATLVTDPFNEDSGYHLGKINADIVTISHAHPQHSFVSGIRGNPKVLSGPGEYEIAGIFIYGIPTFHDAELGRKRGKNIVFLIEIDGVKICHLGDLGHKLSAGQIEEIDDTEILLIPVGGVSTIGAAEAAELVNLIEPKIVIPMHFKTEAEKMPLEPLDKFLKEMGIKKPSPIPKLSVTKQNLPAETQVVILDYKQ